jgi:hypothetical protein
VTGTECPGSSTCREPHHEPPILHGNRSGVNSGFSPPSLPVSAIGTGFETPDSVTSGWHRVRFNQVAAGRGQNLVLFEIDDSLDIERLAAVLDTSGQTPGGVLARGGSESPAPGDTTSVIMHLQPGRYVWTSLTRAGNGRRHVTNGVWRELRVTPAPDTPAAPEPTVSVGLGDHAFLGNDVWPAGRHRIGIANQGKQDHLFYLVRLRGDASLRDWLDDERDVTSDRVGGVTRLGPGQAVQFELALAPGRYAASCLMRDPATGKSHTELGMIRLITVTEAAK